MVEPTKRVNRFRIFCMSRGYTAQGVSEAVKAKTGRDIAKSTIYAYFQGQRFPTKKNMELLVETFGVEVLDCFYKTRGVRK